MPDTQPETPADRIAAFLAEAADVFTVHVVDSSPAGRVAGYGERLLAAVGKVLELHHETAGKCATCLGYWPCGEWLILSRELLSGGSTDDH